MYGLHGITPIKRHVLRSTHGERIPPRARHVAIVRGLLLQCAILQRRLPDPRFPRFVMVQHVHELFLVGFLLAFDIRARPVVFPEVGVAAILEEGFGGYGGGGGVFFLFFFYVVGVLGDG